MKLLFILCFLFVFPLFAQTSNDYEQMKEENQRKMQKIEQNENQWMKKNPEHEFKSKETYEESISPDEVLERLPSSKKYQVNDEDGFISRSYKCFARLFLQQQEMPYHKSGAILNCQGNSKDKETCIQNVQKASEQMGMGDLFSNWKECVSQ